MLNVNWIAVIISAVVATAIGFAWYSPLFFATQWMKLSGLTKEKVAANNKNMPLTYGIQIASSVVAAYVLSVFISYTGAVSIFEGAKIGLWVWLGFVATVMLSTVLYEGKSWTLYFINAGYQLVVFVVMGALLTVL